MQDPVPNRVTTEENKLSLILGMLKWRPPTDLLAAVSSAHNSDGGRSCSASPESTGYASEDESVESDVTLEEAVELFSDFGHPLERMPRSQGRIAELDLDSAGRFGHGTIYHPYKTCSSRCSSPSLPFVTSCTIDYHAVVDDFLSLPDNPFDDLDPQNFVTFDPNPTASLSLPPQLSLMVKRIPRESTELAVISDLHSVDLRQDPWNPCPHILQTIDQGPASQHVYLFMERLNEFNAPPMETVAQYIDFFRQILEGMSFLHEHQFAGFSCADPNSFMVDLSSGLGLNDGSYTALLVHTMSQGQERDPSTTPKGFGTGDRHHHRYLIQSTDAANFDRSIYPVRYYFVNFTRTRRIQRGSSDRLTVSLPSYSERTSPFKKDVKELGTLLERLMTDMPSVVCTKFRVLIKAMTVGGFEAEDARKLFEALAQSLDPSIFELTVRRGFGLRSRSSVFSETGAMSGSTYAPSTIRGDFGLEPDTAALSS